MLEAAARSRLERMVAASSAPELTAGEVDDLLALAQRPDDAGRAPTEDGWEGAYDLRAAAAEGYRWKAAKVAGDVSWSADGRSVSADQARAGLLAMATHYDTEAGALGGLGSLDTTPTDMPLDPRTLGVANL